MDRANVIQSKCLFLCIRAHLCLSPPVLRWELAVGVHIVGLWGPVTPSEVVPFWFGHGYGRDHGSG